MNLLVTGLAPVAIAVLLGSLPWTPAHGQDAGHETYTVDALVRRAISENPSLAASKLAAEGAHHVAPQAGSLEDPMFSVTIPPRPVHTARGAQRSQWRIEQSLPFPGKRALRRDMAERDAEAASYRVDRYAQNVAMEVRLVYADLFEIQEKLRLVETFRSDLERFEEAAAAQYEVGRGPQQALLRAQLEKNLLSQTELSLLIERRRSESRMARVTDDLEFASTPCVMERPLALETLPDDPTASTAVEARPDLTALLREQERARDAISLARKDRYPDFSLMMQYTDIVKSSPPANPDGMDAFSVGAGIRIPLWRGKIRSRIEETQLTALQLEAETEALTLGIQTEIEELRQRYQIGVESVSLLEQGLIPQAEVTLDATLSAYTTGTAAFIDLLEAERALFGLRIELVSVRAELHRTVASLLNALGQSTN